MIYLLFLFSVAYASPLETFLQDLPCDIPIRSELPDDIRSIDEPFIYRRGTSHLKQMQNDLSIDNLLQTNGDVKVGIDYAGSTAPVTKLWQSTTLGEYLREYVIPLEKMSMEEASASELKYMYLWGPTDPFDEFIPDNVKQQYECLIEDPTKIIWGVAGKYTGLAFHDHPVAVLNEIIYGKKLWLMYPEGTKMKTRNLTSMELLEMMVNDYMGQSGFEMPQMCIVEEGDVAYIPFNWVHMSYNIETTTMVGCVFYP